MRINRPKPRLHYALLVLGPSYGTQQAYLAYQFSQALITKQHKIETIFFYGDGVLNALAETSPANDEYDLSAGWARLHNEHHISLQFCGSAGLRRGVSANSYAPYFTVSSLAEWSEILLKCDRVIQF